MKSSKSQSTVSSLQQRVIRWSQDRVLSVARERTRKLIQDQGKVQVMLTNLMVESGWTDEEFVDALCRDVIKNNSPKSRN